MEKRALVWVESYRGAGHLAVAYKLASALSTCGIRVSLASSNIGAAVHDSAYSLSDRVYESVILPGFTDLDGSITENGIPANEDQCWNAKRRDLLCKEFNRVRYDLLVIETWPFSKSPQHDEELQTLVDVASDRGCTVVIVVRDILCAPIPGQTEKAYRKGMWGGSAARLVTLITDRGIHVVVRGDNRLHPFSDSFPEALALGELLHSPGYYASSRCKKNDLKYSRSRPVVVSVGGWAFPTAPVFYKTWIQARKGAGVLSENPWLVFVPSSLRNEDFAMLQRVVDQEPDNSRIKLLRNSREFRDLLPSAMISISSGGYNTCLEAIAHHTPSVVTPMGSTEQLLRAKRLCERGLAEMCFLPRNSLETNSFERNQLATEWGDAVSSAYSKRAVLRDHGVGLDGSERSADLMLELIQGRSASRRSMPELQAKQSSSVGDLRPEALLLDWDDTCIDLGDSVDRSFDVAIEKMASLGFHKERPWTLANKRDGTAPYEPALFFKGLFSRPTSAAMAFEFQRKAYLRFILDGCVQVIPGLQDLLRWCTLIKLPVAIASNSPEDLVRAMWSIFLGEEFLSPVIVCATTCVPPKPSQALYSLARGALRLRTGLQLDQPRRIYAVGDSLAKDGVPADLLGLTFVHMSRRGHVGETSNNTRKVTDHHELLALLGAAFRSDVLGSNPEKLHG